MPNNNKKETVMAAKKVDYDNDGIISDREVELEIKLEKANTQTRLALIAIISMVVVLTYLVSPWGPSKEMIEILDSVISTYFVAMASVVGAYMGFSAWMSKK